ncbi:hypothetical protein M8J77_018983 [Diaphorina citri]|nr:hypothetical protein M8J77_018983 [Diaphorina citri]
MINLDLDGDTIILCVCPCFACLLENAVQADVVYNMYRPFGHTALTFNQPHHMIVHKYANEFERQMPAWAKPVWALSAAHFHNTKDRMAAVLLVLSKASRASSSASPNSKKMPPKAAYSFLTSVTDFCNAKLRTDSLPISDLESSAVADGDDDDDGGSTNFECIYESGATGDKLIANRLRTIVPRATANMTAESFAQHNTLVSSNSNVSEKFYTFYQLIQTAQNVRLDPSGSIIYTVGERRYNFGHVSSYFSGNLIFSNFEVDCIEADIL